MPKITLEIPSDVEAIITKHAEIDWNKLISNTLWSYTKKLKLLDAIASKSTLADDDLDELDHMIKSGISSKYQQ
ncbi:MAG: hypothetical protein WCQ99_17370 [Pseudomonadota bacterium]